ncbi:MAG: hypothetical protein IJ419_15335 [Agathobacter sp.]|nr:hypothetical protein [Agathobacter sp.]
MEQLVDLEKCLAKIDEVRITDTAAIYIWRTKQDLGVYLEYSEDKDNNVCLLEFDGTEYVADNELWKALHSLTTLLKEKYAATLIEDDVLNWVKGL